MSAVRVPDTPDKPKITFVSMGKLKVEVPKVDGAIFYGCILIPHLPKPDNLIINNEGQLEILAVDDEPTQILPLLPIRIDLNKSRKKTFSNLTSRIEYFFYFYAANTNGISRLSEGSSMSC